MQKSLVLNPEKIVVRATNWVGDGVMSLPALEALRGRFPTAEIVLVVKPWVADLYLHHPAVNRLIVYDAANEHQGPSGFAKLVEQVRSERFDMAVLFQNAFHAAWMAWRSRIPVRIGYGLEGRGVLLTNSVPVPPPALYGHQSNYYLQLLFRAGLVERITPVESIHLNVENSEKTWAARQLKSLGLGGPRFLVGLAPGAAFGPAKRWLLDRYADLADRLIGALNADVLIFGSPAEKPLAEEIAHGMSHTPVIMTGETTLRQLMALLVQCRLVITNDSGPMHLAAAMGLPLVAIFGSTDETATGPVSPLARVVRHPVACSPCGLRVCPIDFRCMKGVTVDHVHRIALGLIKEYGVTHERPATQS
ncbi:MAG: lipopolysaccharide heptosyltransferase II [Acidobacteria bacterium]|nr:MAG: lipopolysaccharide heptosyltransferase II [Acidobacteriota bacterium]